MFSAVAFMLTYGFTRTILGHLESFGPKMILEPPASGFLTPLGWVVASIGWFLFWFCVATLVKSAFRRSGRQARGSSPP